MTGYSIKEMSERYGLPASTLRYYEDEGILPNVGRSPSGRRLYSEENVGRLEAICCFKRAGMTIPQLKRFFAYEEDERRNIGSMLGMLRDQEARLAEELGQLREDYAHIQKKVGYFGEVKAAIDGGREVPSWCGYLESLEKPRR
jgi:Predicted transcriptional regulators